ncbi:MAG: damage-inducible protein DinB [Acidobacteria bacterium]|nr:damage-inducible protein DinB [Acidobacteriota bacterium]
MKNYLTGLRYVTGLLAINMALTLVGFAQAAQPDAAKRMRPSAGDPATVERMVADWTRAKAFTKEYLDAMPADGITFTPSKDIRTFGQQMLHLTAAHFGFASQATGVNPPAGLDVRNLEKMKEYEDKAALTKIVLDSYDFIIDAFKNLDAAKYNEKFKLFGAFDTTRLGAFEKAFEHQTHHRGQTTIYLRMKGVKPPNEKLF